MLKSRTDLVTHVRLAKLIVSSSRSSLIKQRSSYVSVGDSHSACTYYAGLSDIVHLGPITMHRVGRDRNLTSLIIGSLLTMGSIASIPSYVEPLLYRVLSARTVVLYFGEIDCRVHIGKYVSQACPYDEVCDKLVDGYCSAVSAVSHQHPKLDFLVTSIMPPTQYGGDSDYPTKGTLLERVQYTNYINERLSHTCTDLGLPYVNYAKHIPVNNNGAILDEFTDGTVHLHPRYAQWIDQEIMQFNSIL
jgi:hypothetical protein